MKPTYTRAQGSGHVQPHAHRTRICLRASTALLGSWAEWVRWVSYHQAGTHLWLQSWQAKQSRWYTLSRARITISKAGISLLQAAQFPVVPKSLQRGGCGVLRGQPGSPGEGEGAASSPGPTCLPNRTY